MNAQQQVAVVEPESARVTTPMTMIESAVAKGASIETIDKLMTLHERWEANQARRAFVEARAAAKARIAEEPIIKNRAGHNNKAYADLSAIAGVIDPILATFGLSYGFETTQTDRITVTCVLSHVGGHEQRNTLSGPPDQTGSKNAIQAIGSTLTYLQRYTLVAALGLSATDDDDGNAVGGAGPVDEGQVEVLRAAIVETGADLEKFLKFYKVEKLEQLPASKFEDAKRKLMQRAGEAKRPS